MTELRALLVAAAVARLKGLAGLASVAVFDAPPVRGGLPHAVVEEPVIADASVATTVRLPRLRDVPRALERSCDSTVS